MMSLFQMPYLFAMLTPPAFVEFSAVIPGAILTLAALSIVLLDVFHINETDRGYLSHITAIAFAVTFASVCFLWNHTLEAPTFHGMLYLDRFGLFFAGLVSVIGVVSSLSSSAYLRMVQMERSEFYILTLFSAAGMIFMAQSADLLSIFISLEVMSIPLYCIAAFVRLDKRSAEAGLKYFIMGAFSTALTLYGVALIYGVTGTTNLEAISVVLEQVLASDAVSTDFASHVAILGSFLVLSGFLFKVAAAPFHLWAPDVYTGSPTPTTGFMATGVKAVSFAVILRLILTAFDVETLIGGVYGMGWADALLAFAAFSVVVGNFAALAQSNVKRMLAYSSIAHAGYILVGVVAANIAPTFFMRNDAVLFYLAAYAFTTLGAFGILSYLGKVSGNPVETYEDLAGVGLRYPFVGLLMSIFMFSSAGIPPTAGFLAKFYIFRSAVDVATQTGDNVFIGIAILSVLASVCGVYYYLKVLVTMYMGGDGSEVRIIGGSALKVTLIACAGAVLYTGIFPQQVIDFSQAATVDMVGPRRVEEARQKGYQDLSGRLSEKQKELGEASLGKVRYYKPVVVKPVEVRMPAEVVPVKEVRDPAESLKLQPLQRIRPLKGVKQLNPEALEGLLKALKKDKPVGNNE